MTAAANNSASVGDDPEPSRSASRAAGPDLAVDRAGVERLADEHELRARRLRAPRLAQDERGAGAGALEEAAVELAGEAHEPLRAHQRRTEPVDEAGSRDRRELRSGNLS